MAENNRPVNIVDVLRSRPMAVAVMNGDRGSPGIQGMVKFYDTRLGVLVAVEIIGLPREMGECGRRVFGFHIHSGGECAGNPTDPFADAGMHYNPHGCSHPYHAGDMPPLFSAGGRALSIFLTNRFTVDEIIGKTVIIHDSPDDFTTQPSGNSGNKIACGVVFLTARQYS